MNTGDPTIRESLIELKEQLESLVATNAKLAAERDQYRKLYLNMLEQCRKLELGILSQKRERLQTNDEQLTLSLLGMLLGDNDGGSAATADPESKKVREHERRKPTGRKPLPEKLPRVEIEVLPPEVQEKGLEAFERIGEDVTETVERRPASIVVVRIRKPKFVPKGRDRLGETTVLQASSPELPIERGVAGPGMLADTIVRRWQEHTPLHRLESSYGREGYDLARTTMCTWHIALALLAKPLIDAMWDDALTSPYLCTDATGVLVQAREKCHRSHFWVVVAPELHVLFGFTEKHDSAAIDQFLGRYKGHLVADAHAVFNHLFKNGDVIEVACWAHTRRYFFKALSSDPDRAQKALTYIGALFRLERTLAQAPPEKRLLARKTDAKPIVDAFFSWCDEQALVVLDDTPISKGIGYARNQRKALERFLEDGRLPIHNNWSERELRREAIGRKNWIFIGSDDGALANTTFVSLLASCQLHGIEPWSYLRDLFCLLPSWPRKRVLELAPAYWRQACENAETQQRLAANVYRQVTLGLLDEHRATN